MASGSLKKQTAVINMNPISLGILEGNEEFVGRGCI